MIKRIQRVIDRGKKQNPDCSASGILWKRVKEILLDRTVAKYRQATKNSVFFLESEMHMCSLFPKEALDILIDHFRPRSVLDIGCGLGRSLAYFLSKNIEATGVEGSRLAISKSDYPQLIIQHNLNKELDLNRKFDVVWCFEVIEHIHAKFEDTFVNSLIRHSDNLVLSAAPPGQGGHGHFNEKPMDYWIKKFKSMGYSYLHELSGAMQKTNSKNAKNIMVFQKRSDE